MAYQRDMHLTQFTDYGFVDITYQSSKDGQQTIDAITLQDASSGQDMIFDGEGNPVSVTARTFKAVRQTGKALVAAIEQHPQGRELIDTMADNQKMLPKNLSPELTLLRTAVKAVYQMNMPE